MVIRALLLLLSASLVIGSISRPHANESHTLACNFVLRKGRTPPHVVAQHSKQSTCRSTAHCLISKLGWPNSSAELFVAYLAAVHDYCTTLSSSNLTDMAQCNEVPFCQALLLDADDQPFLDTQFDKSHEVLNDLAAQWYRVVVGKPPKYECKPDWFSVLMQPCGGSPAAEMQHCLRERPGSGQACAKGCTSLSLVLEKGYCNTAECWPQWVLKQLCNSTVQELLNSTRLGWCTDVYCPRECNRYAPRYCDEPCVHEVCAVAAHYVQEYGWTGFHGQCKHTVVVDGLLANAVSMFEGGGCSVLHWVDNSTIDISVLMGKVCQGTYPRPAYIMPVLLKSSAAGKVWLAAAATNALKRNYRDTGDGFVDLAMRSSLAFASIQQAALIQCPAGYRAMDRALSKPWLLPQLLAAVLPPDSAWLVRLLQGKPICADTTDGKLKDVCVELQVANFSGEGQLAPWLVSKTSMSVLEAYCRQAFAPFVASSPLPPATVTATCDKTLVNTDRIRLQQAAQRTALAGIWYSYVCLLFIGFLALHLYWRLPEHRSRGQYSRCAWFTSFTACLCHMVCPSAPEYHSGTPQAASSGQSLPGVSGGRWRGSLFSNVTMAAQALAYCADVGLDIWTLVEVRKNADSLSVLASAYHSAGAYSTQLRWRSGHSDMLFWWLVIVFAVQYAAGIVLTLPPTLAAYGVFDYRKLQFSWGCCTLVFVSGACGIFVSVFFCVGLWYIVVADIYMLLALVGVPARLLQGNRLNLSAYTTVRYLCEGIIEALPSALISTAAINQQLLSQETNKMQLAVFWMSLLFSMLRIARELFKLAQLTHELGACCFSTAILDMIFHVQPQQGYVTASVPVQLVKGAYDRSNQAEPVSSIAAGSKPTPPWTADTVVSAPQPDTGMTRDSTEISPAHGLAGAAAPADVLPPWSPADEAAAAANVSAGIAGTLNGPAPDSSGTSKQRRGCCWHCQSCTEYPTVLAVYVYCCLGCIMVYLLLVCSDITYPWLLATDMRLETVCRRDASGVLDCGQYWNRTLPPFRQQYNLLVMTRSVPGFSNGSNADCVLPSLTCYY